MIPFHAELYLTDLESRKIFAHPFGFGNIGEKIGFPGAKLEDAERKTRDGKEVFEVEIEVGNDDKEIIITAEGEILKVVD